MMPTVPHPFSRTLRKRLGIKSNVRRPDQKGRLRRVDCRTPRPTCGSRLCGRPVMMRQGKAMADTSTHISPGARFRAALAAKKPLQVVGAINAYVARLAQATGFRAIYLSGGGV